MVTVKRAYRALQRQRQALATRQRITTSARQLFARHGFAATTIEAIALDAEVAVQTVYATFGSKRGILLALLDIMEVEGRMVPQQEQTIPESTDPALQIRRWVIFTRHFFEQGADLLNIVWTAGLADPDILAAWREGERRRRERAEIYAKSWAQMGILRAGVSENEAADIMWTLLGPEIFRLLVGECKWPGERYEAWLIGEMEALLQ